MGREGICFCASGAVAEYTESWESRFLSFLYVRDAHPYRGYRTRAVERPSGDYVRLKLFVSFLLNFEIGSFYRKLIWLSVIRNLSIKQQRWLAQLPTSVINC